MTEILWTLNDLLTATRATCSGSTIEAGFTGVSIDSRTIEPGEIFVAIQGDRFDGHIFVDKALAAGAGCAIVEHGFQTTSENAALVRVKDPLEALNALGREARERASGRIIAITGSVGKTGTKEALRLALGACGRVHASEKSYNNHWGVPLSLARLPKNAAFGVFEVGMNHPGEITPLSKMIRPEIAVVTTVEAVHLGFFKSVEEIAEAKAEIFAGLMPEGIAVLNRDNVHFQLLRTRAGEAGARVVGFGRHDDADARLLRIEADATGSTVTASVLGEPLTYRVGAPGEHIVMNSLAVLTAAVLAGADLERAAAALARLSAPKGRGEQTIVQRPGGPILVIDESYNANPASIRAALATLGQVSRRSWPRRVAVLGDMLELGDRSKELHSGLAPAVIEAEVDVVLACGPDMTALYEALPSSLRGGCAKSADGLAEMLAAKVEPGDAVMIKGSLGSRMGPLVEMLKVVEINAASG